MHATNLYRSAAGLLLAFAAIEAGAEPSRPYFSEVARQAGAAVRHHPPVFDPRLSHVMEMVAAGAAGGAVGDFNNDGWMDIFVNDARLGTENKLLRNNGDFTFTDVAAAAGLAGLNRDNQVSSMGLFFDFNGDGWQDLLVVRMGLSLLFENRRDGTFKDVTAQTGMTSHVNALSAIAFDFDRDGDIDIYLGSYFPDTNMFDLDRKNVLHDSWETSRNGGNNVLYRNEGEGRFVDATKQVGLEDTGWTMAIGHADYDNDGWQDVYVANDYGPDKLFRNTGKGRFEDVTQRAIGTDTKKGMNAEFGDFDNDGDFDVYVTNVTEEFLHECNMLWQNNGDGTFTDVSTELNVCDTGWAWGAKFLDYDNDGWLDLYVANGFFTGKGDYLEVLLPALWDSGEDPSDPAVWPPLNGMGIAGSEANVLFTNARGRSFVREQGSGVEARADSRAVLLADFDNDGRVDMFVTNQDAEALLYRNQIENGHHWLQVHLRGAAPNTDAIGARVVVEAGGRRMMREVNAGNGFGGASSFVQHFGLGKVARIDRIEVRWPGGEVQEWKGLDGGAILRLKQGSKDVERIAPREDKQEVAAPAAAPASAPAKPSAGPSRSSIQQGSGERYELTPEQRAMLFRASLEAPVSAPAASEPERESAREPAHSAAPAARPAAEGRRPGSAGTAAKPAFVDLSASAGVDHLHHGPSVDERLRNLGPWFTALGAGGAVGDYNNDGLEDIYVTDNLRGYPNVLYRNDGSFKFTDVAKQAGVADLNDEKNFSSMALFADCDNDGWKDLFVLRFGQSMLFRNKADGTFEDITDQFGIPRFRNPVAIVALDHDRDGDLDIYIGSYFPDVDLTNVQTTKLLHDSWETARNGGTNVMLRNEGSCRYTDVTNETNLADTGWTLAVGTADIDRDGWTDLYVANDFGPDKVYRNMGNGRFADYTDRAIGVDTKKSMNTEFGDYDNDGWMDVYVTNITEPFLHECNMLWRNNGDFSFTDVSEPTGTCDTDWGWGAKFIDFDNNGWQDLFVLNGFISGGEKDYIDILMPIILDSDVDLSDTRSWPPLGEMSFSGYEKNHLFYNTGRHSFLEVAAEHGVDADTDSRGLMVADFDNDGAQDMYVLNSNQRAILYRNVIGAEKAWIEIRLEGTKSNRDAIGTKVTFRTPQGIRYRETNAGNGFEGQGTPAVHAGLGDLESVDRIVVEWPSGAKQEFENVRTRVRYKLVEGGELTPIPAASAAQGSAPSPAAEKEGNRAQN